MVKGKGLYDSVITKIPIELHLPWDKHENVNRNDVPDRFKRNIMSYCGANTEVNKRVMMGYQGVNKLDNACRSHDIAYSLYKNDKERRKISDRILAEKALQIANDPTLNPKERMYSLGVYKIFEKDGVFDKFGGQIESNFISKYNTRSKTNKNNGKIKNNDKNDFVVEIEKNLPSKIGKNSVKEPVKDDEKKSKVNTRDDEYMEKYADELHKPVKKKFKRRKVFIPEKNHTWGMREFKLV